MAQSTSIVIFGASGDLTQRKLIPALFDLYRKNRLPEDFHILGFAITEWDDEDFRQALADGVEQFAEYEYSRGEWEQFKSRLHYQIGSFTEQGDFAS